MVVVIVVVVVVVETVVVVVVLTVVVLTVVVVVEMVVARVVLVPPCSGGVVVNTAIIDLLTQTTFTSDVLPYFPAAMMVHPDGSPVENVYTRRRQLAQPGCVACQLPMYPAVLHRAVLRQRLAHASTEFSLASNLFKLTSGCPVFAHTMQTWPSAAVLSAFVVVVVDWVVVVLLHGSPCPLPFGHSCTIVPFLSTGTFT